MAKEQHVWKNHVNLANLWRKSICKTFVKGCFWKSCTFGTNCAITVTVCRNNFLTYHQVVLLYYFNQKILKEKAAIFKKGNFFGQACFLHPGNQVSVYHAYIFPSCDLMNYLYIKYLGPVGSVLSLSVLETWGKLECPVNIKFSYKCLCM